MNKGESTWGHSKRSVFSANQGQRPLPAPWSWTSSLQSYESINFCLSHSVWYFVTKALGNNTKWVLNVPSIWTVWAVILATQHSSVTFLVTVLAFPSEDPSLLPSFPLFLSVQVIWWNTWIPAKATGIGSEIEPMQWNFRGNCWKRALFSFARQEPRSTYSGAAGCPCKMWMALKQQKAEQGERKRNRNRKPWGQAS